MVNSNRLWDFFERVLFEHKLSRAALSIGLIVAIQLVTSLCMVYVLTSGAGSAGQGSGPMADALGSVYRIAAVGLILAALTGLWVYRMITYLGTKPLETVNALYEQLLKIAAGIGELFSSD